MADEILAVEYRAVDGFPGYRVGSDSSAWSCRGWGFAYGRTVRWRKIKPLLGKFGYFHVNLRQDKKLFHCRVNRIVCAAFHGPCPSGFECCHNDGNKQNNLPGNLRWGSKADNYSDRRSHGTHNNGERHGRAKLVDADIPVIRKKIAAGSDRQQVADSYGVSKSTINNIIRFANWTHIPIT